MPAKKAGQRQRNRSLATLIACCEKGLREDVNLKYQSVDVYCALKAIDSLEESESIWEALDAKHQAGLVALLVLSIQRSSFASVRTNAERSAYIGFRTAIVKNLCFFIIRRASSNSVDCVIRSVLKAQTLRGFALVLLSADAHLARSPSRNTKQECDWLLEEVLRFVKVLLQAQPAGEDAASLEATAEAGSDSGLPNKLLMHELVSSSLLDHCARLLLRLSEHSDMQTDVLLRMAKLWEVYAILCLQAHEVATRILSLSPALSYALSSQLVALCSALDGGCTYGMPLSLGLGAATVTHLRPSLRAVTAPPSESQADYFFAVIIGAWANAATSERHRLNDFFVNCYRTSVNAVSTNTVASLALNIAAAHYYRLDVETIWPEVLETVEAGGDPNTSGPQSCQATLGNTVPSGRCHAPSLGPSKDDIVQLTAAGYRACASFQPLSDLYRCEVRFLDALLASLREASRQRSGDGSSRSGSRAETLARKLELSVAAARQRLQMVATPPLNKHAVFEVCISLAAAGTRILLDTQTEEVTLGPRSEDAGGRRAHIAAEGSSQAATAWPLSMYGATMLVCQALDSARSVLEEDDQLSKARLPPKYGVCLGRWWLTAVGVSNALLGCRQRGDAAAYGIPTWMHSDCVPFFLTNLVSLLGNALNNIAPSSMTELPAQPHHDVAAALAVGLLPCLKRVLQCLVEFASETSAASQMLFDGDVLTQILAFGNQREVSALIDTVADLLAAYTSSQQQLNVRKMEATTRMAHTMLDILPLDMLFAEGERSQVDESHSDGENNSEEDDKAGISMDGSSADRSGGSVGELEDKHVCPSGSQVVDITDSDIPGMTHRPAIQQLGLMVSYTAVRLMPVISRVLAEVLELESINTDTIGILATRRSLLARQLAWAAVLVAAGAAANPELTQPYHDTDGSRPYAAAVSSTYTAAAWRKLLLLDLRLPTLLGVALGMFRVPGAKPVILYTFSTRDLIGTANTFADATESMSAMQALGAGVLAVLRCLTALRPQDLATMVAAADRVANARCADAATRGVSVQPTPSLGLLYRVLVPGGALPDGELLERIIHICGGLEHYDEGVAGSESAAAKGVNPEVVLWSARVPADVMEIVDGAALLPGPDEVRRMLTCG